MKNYKILCESAISPQKYVEAITGKCFIFNADTIGGLIEEIQTRCVNEGFDNLWDYPLCEIDQIIENGLSVILVELTGEDTVGDVGTGKWTTVLRWFEVPEDLNPDNFTR